MLTIRAPTRVVITRVSKVAVEAKVLVRLVDGSKLVERVVCAIVIPLPLHRSHNSSLTPHPSLVDLLYPLPVLMMF